MLKERRHAVEAVSAAFLLTEQAAEQTALLGARCIVAMIEQRAAANLPMAIGSDALALVADATARALNVRATLVAAHKLLADLPAAIGITAFGADECPPNQPFIAAPLRSVA